MANSEQLKILKQGTEVWNKWRNDTPKIMPDLSRADLSEANLSKANLFRANLREADLFMANLEDALLSGANLSRAKLSGAKLSRAVLRGADLFMAYLLSANLSGALLIGAKLSSAKLSGADLSGAVLCDAKLIKANLRGVNLKKADLSRADLSEANLSKADLNGADLRNANLRGADLSGADLLMAYLKRTNVNNANLSDAKIGYTTIGDVDLSNVSDLERTIHFGPSTIGIDTFYRSGGKIPHKFLEDAGVPDNFIEYMGSLTGQAFQYYSCFISHSTNDKDFADRIYADLRKEGVRCWFAPEDIKGGKKIHQQLDEAIRFYDKLLLILSEESINSDWVANEIIWARKREKQEGRKKLFPVTLIDYEKLKSWELFDADTATDLAAEVRSYFIPDFKNWKVHNDYLLAFNRLLRDLQTEE